MSNGNMNLTLKVWRQSNSTAAGKMETYQLGGVSPDMSFLEMIDMLNEQIIRKGEDAIAFDHDCREGICGMCSLTINGVHFHEAGESRLAKEIYPSLFGENAPAVETPEAAKVRALVNEKSAMWHSRYRSVDGYNIYGDRSKIAYVSHPDAPKITNTQVMMEEMAQRDAITTNYERKTWALAAGKTGPVEMVSIPMVTA